MITIRDIIQNIAKGQSSIAVRYVLDELDKNFMAIKTRITIMFSKPLDTGTLIYLKIPSSDKATYYDVVLWINSQTRLTLDSEIKCYSNSPSFAYNFAYIFNVKGSLLFPEKYPREFALMPPKVRNPFGLFGFDKHIYAAIKFVGKQYLITLNQNFEGKLEPEVLSLEEKQAELKRFE